MSVFRRKKAPQEGSVRAGHGQDIDLTKGIPSLRYCGVLPEVYDAFSPPRSVTNSEGHLRCMGCGSFPIDYSGPCSCGRVDWNPRLEEYRRLGINE